MKNNEAYKRRMYVYELRQKGLIFKEIAKIMNFSENRARQLFESAKRIKNNDLLQEKS